MSTRPQRTRLIVTVVVAVVVVAAAIGVTVFVRSTGQRLQRAANDLNSLPGVESAQVDDSAPSRASQKASDARADRILIKLRTNATRRQVVDLIKRAAVETADPDTIRVFYIESRRATTCVCDDTTDRASTVAAELLAVGRVGDGRAYVYDDTSIGLDPPSDETGARTLQMARQTLDLLARAKVAMPRRFETYDGVIALTASVGTPAQLSAVLQRSGRQLSDGWRVDWLSGRRLSFTVPPGVGLTATMIQMRGVADALASVGPRGRPIVARVVASSADKSAYANIVVPRG